MSRVGKKPAPLPKGVKINIGEQLEVEGPKGKLSVPIPPGVHLRQDGQTLHVERDGDQYAALHGLTRALAANAIQGVSTGRGTGVIDAGRFLGRAGHGQYLPRGLSSYLRLPVSASCFLCALLRFLEV